MGSKQLVIRVAQRMDGLKKTGGGKMRCGRGVVVDIKEETDCPNGGKNRR